MSSPESPSPAERPDATKPPQSWSNVLQKVLDWLKAGYPQGIPQSDYVALLAVLHRRLTDYEVHLVVEQLVSDRVASGDIARADIAAAIARVAKEQPGEDDIARVASRLAAGGWPLATPTSD
ncbi:DUF3349 domain-containing protein [Nocardia sp. 2]|uniref:DUF3349 domain-containing protein n=1 Tax=Nocardia acididurans TaxID=2802282 RepID=A0ABS1M5Q7_9NOCA|nr:DUF3349 domain-containing protein [Nocardia acididurans]MBL1075651.1 DUF3349 domain-containing protein [Nocardia acididurans]